jgi:poly-gamma-glutamate capsule biosynthesis protein CapA/YwtB (metallophosphatase superfamily)
MQYARIARFARRLPYALAKRASILCGFIVGSVNWLGLKLRGAAEAPASRKRSTGTVRLFLCGDVMTGRAIDQIMVHPNSPELYERHIKDARQYVAMAEKVSGPIPRGVGPAYVWGEALAKLDHAEPDVRIINLETSITTGSSPWLGKKCNYRMNPDHIDCLSAARIDCCVLANNHVLDWGREGLAETLSSLRAAGIGIAGAGETSSQAVEPAIVDCGPDGRVLIFAYGSQSSGIRDGWGASVTESGVQLFDESDPMAIERVAGDIRSVKRRGDVAVVSIHWGENWGFEVPDVQQHFARRLIDQAGADVVHGHSSHHPRPLEVYQGKLILYGCGDLINDYEGITGYEGYRPDLVGLYLADVDSASGRLQRLSIVPMRLKKFQLTRASWFEVEWLRNTLNWHGRTFGARLKQTGAEALELVSK